MKTKAYSKILSILAIFSVIAIAINPSSANEFLSDNQFSGSWNDAVTKEAKIVMNLNEVNFDEKDPEDLNDPNRNTGVDGASYYEVTSGYNPIVGSLTQFDSGSDINEGTTIVEGGSSDEVTSGYIPIVGGISGSDSNVGTFGLEISGEELPCYACEGCKSGEKCEDPELFIEDEPINYCGSCGEIIESHYDFCHSCGAGFDDINNIGGEDTFSGANTAVGDMNGDGHPDVITDCNNQDCSVHLNNGDGTLGDGQLVAIDDAIDSILEFGAVKSLVVRDAAANDEEQSDPLDYFLVQFVDMNKDNKTEAIVSNGDGFSIRHNIGNNAYKDGDEFVFEIERANNSTFIVSNAQVSFLYTHQDAPEPFTVSLSQTSGPDGTRVIVTVSGATPNSSLTVSVDGWPTHTGTDVNGNYSGEETMGGFPGDIKTITVQIDNANGVTETVTKIFKIVEPGF